MHVARFCLVMLFPLVWLAMARADECDPNDPLLLKPELRSLDPTRIRQSLQPHNPIIVFTSSIANTGDGPFVVHGRPVDTPEGPKTEAIQEIWRSDGTKCTHLIGHFIYHPTHYHFHLEDVAAYELRKDNPYTGEVVARSEKASFCLLDIARLSGYSAWPQFTKNCTDPNGTYGISVGFADVYESLIPGQEIDLSNVPAGDYFLVNRVNPDKNIWEKNDSSEDNTGFASVKIRAAAVRLPTPLPTATFTPTTALPTPVGATTVRMPRQPHSPSMRGDTGGPRSPRSPFIPPRTRVPRAPRPPR